MTYDNGIEMARHQKITQKTGMKIYFATHIRPGKEEPMKTQMNSLGGTSQMEPTSMKLMKNTNEYSRKTE